MSPAVRLTTDYGSKLHLAAPAREQVRWHRPSKYGHTQPMRTRCGVFGLPVHPDDETPRCRRCFAADKGEAGR